MKKLFFALFALGNVVQLQAEQWLDVTDRYVVNPKYEGNTNEGWTWYANAGSTNTSYGCQEFWNGTFDMSQTVSGLSNGRYRIEVQAYYRNGGASYNQYINYLNGNTGVTAYLYGNSTETPVQSIYVPTTGFGYPGTTTVYGNGESYTIPNTMESAASYFSNGNYQNSLEVNVTNGTLTFGIYNNTYTNSNWCIFTNWKLKYYATPVYFTSLSLAESSILLGRGETYTLVPQVAPAITSASVYDFQWTSSNNAVVMVTHEGVVKGLKNGTAIVTCKDKESGLSAQVSVKVESVAMSSDNLIINEIQSRNIDQFIDPSWNYGAWVELYNPTATAVFVGGAIVKDDKGHSFRLPLDFGSVPAKGFRNLWFDHNSRYGVSYRQVDFKLDKDGGEIILCDESGVEVIRQKYPAMQNRVSYARTTDGGASWSYTGEASPEASNESSDWATEQLPEPEVDASGCFFTGTKTVKVTVPAGCTLAYTTNGATPTLNNATIYRNTSFNAVNRSLSLTSSTVCRFRLFQTGKLPSEVVTRSYLMNNTYGDLTMPVVSVTANYNDLFGDEYGVYVQGNGNGRPGNGQSAPCNWNMDWERAVNFEYLVPDANGNYGEVVFNQLVDFEMCGGWSRAWEPHSFKLKANKLYGANNLDYPFFDNKPYNRNKTLQLRNGGNDTGCRLKDAALQEIVRRSGLYLDCQAWQPAHVFINGEYKRVLNIREPNNKHFAFANYGIDTDFIDQFEISPDSGYVQKSGTKDAFNRWYELSQNCADEAVYQLICDSLVDIEEYINYMAVEFYLGATDWPQNNVKGFRALQDDENGHPVGKFHFVLFDLDGTFSTNTPLNAFADKQIYYFDALYGIDEFGNDITGQHYTEEIEFVTIFLNMLQNNQFKKQFTDVFCLVAGSVFEPTRCNSIISEMQGVMNQALSPEWGNSDKTASNLISSLSSSRQTSMVSHLRSYLNLASGRKVTLSSNIEGARLLVNGFEVPTGKFSGTLIGQIQVQAMAPAGYKFVGWSNKTAQSNAFTLFDKGTSWHYYANGSLDGTTWYADMSSYPSGNAPLGYGKTVNTTVTGYLPTYYFGKEVNMTSDMLQEDLVLDFVADDGFIIYVNGVEAGRYNMPTGTVTYNSAASSYAPNNPDTGTMTLPKSLFHSGKNNICVEVHNNKPESSDIYWDASLQGYKASEGSYISTDSLYTLGNTTTTLVACFQPVSLAEEVAALHFPVKVNEVGASNDVYVNEYWKKNDWIELYNTTQMDLDVAGLYVSDNADKPEKYQIAATNFSDVTLLPAGGKLVLWADKLETDTQLHTGFKLGNEAGSLVLIRSSELFESNNAAYFAAHPEMRGFADVLVYDVQEYTQSVGRFPDGGKSIYLMNRPTIGETNRHQQADLYLGEDKGIHFDDPSGIEEITIDDPAEETLTMEERLSRGLYFDLQGRRVKHPVPGQLILQGRTHK